MIIFYPVCFLEHSYWVNTGSSTGSLVHGHPPEDSTNSSPITGCSRHITVNNNLFQLLSVLPKIWRNQVHTHMKHLFIIFIHSSHKKSHSRSHRRHFPHILWQGFRIWGATRLAPDRHLHIVIGLDAGTHLHSWPWRDKKNTWRYLDHSSQTCYLIICHKPKRLLSTHYKHKYFNYN